MIVGFVGGFFLGAGYAVLAYRYHQLLLEKSQRMHLLIISSFVRILVTAAIIGLVLYTVEWERTTSLLGIVGGYVGTMLWCHRRS